MTRAYLAANPSWGSLHVMLCDANLSNEIAQFCADYARESGDEEGAALADLCVRMTASQRGRISKRLPCWSISGP